MGAEVPTGTVVATAGDRPGGHAVTTHLRARHVFDGEVLLDADGVTIDGGEVVAVGAAPPGAAVVELGDATLLPGLVDAHQHLVFDGEGTLEEQVADVTDDELRERARGAARTALAAGITTLRDLGDRGYVTLDLRDDPTLPRILAAGPPITVEGGHCWFLGGGVPVGGLVEAVRERHARGCDVVKVMATGGVHTPTHPVWASQFPADELAAAVAVARELGLPVAAHAHGLDGMREAVQAGVSTIEHGSWVHEGAGPDSPPAVDEALASRLVAAGIPISATLGASPEHDPPPMIRQLLPIVRRNIARYLELGGPLVVGTDAGIEPGKLHDVLPWAAVQLHELGMDAGTVLATITSRAADAIGVGGVTGRLRPGLAADVLAVHGDVAGDLARLRDVAGVWRAGRRVR